MPQGRTFPPTKLVKYPHMFPNDIEVWERFLEKYGELYNEFEYDAKVGEKTWVFPHWNPEYKRNARELSKLRIDVIGYKDRIIDIIEVKPRFSSSAIGQVLTYRNAYISDFAPVVPIRALVVAGEADPNTLPVAKKLGVTYMQV